MKFFKKISFIGLTLIVSIVLYLFTIGQFYSPDFAIPENAAGKHVIINDMKIRYYQTGQGKDIIFLHGGMGSVEDFEPLYSALKNRYRMTSFDRPGYGYSEIKNSAYTLDTSSDIIRQLIKKLNLKNPVIFGHSHGGAIALNLAVQNPKDIKGYILLAPAAYYYERFEKIVNSVPMRLLRIPGINTGIAQTIGPLVGDKMIEETLQRMIVDPDKFPGDFISMRQKLWNKPVSTVTRARQLSAFSKDIQSISKNYSVIQSPVLVVRGENDSFEVNDGSEKLRKTVKNIQLRVIPKSGHYSQFDATSDVVQAIDAFMSKI